MFGIPEVILSFVLGAIVTVLVPYVTRRKHRILYDAESNGLAVPNNLEELSYTYAGKPVDSFYRTSLFLRSFGNTIVKPDELSTEGRLEFFVTEGAILEAILLDGQSHAESRLLVSEDRRTVSLYVDRIGPKDHYKMIILTDGSTYHSLDCKTYILGKPRAIRKSKPTIESAMPVFLLSGVLFLVCSVSFLPPWGDPKNFNSWWAPIAMTGTIVVGYGGAAVGFYEWLFGARAKMRRLQKSTEMIPVDHVIEV